MRGKGCTIAKLHQYSDYTDDWNWCVPVTDWFSIKNIISPESENKQNYMIMIIHHDHIILFVLWFRWFIFNWTQWINQCWNLENNVSQVLEQNYSMIQFTSDKSWWQLQCQCRVYSKQPLGWFSTMSDRSSSQCVFSLAIENINIVVLWSLSSSPSSSWSVGGTGKSIDYSSLFILRSSLIVCQCYHWSSMSIMIIYLFLNQ